MNEEEKQVIDDLKDFISDDSDLTSYDLTIYETKLILNLIEKQQKEIADLKMQNHIIRDMNLTVRLSEEVFDETYIRKDKIREKIKELETYVNDFEEYWSKDPRQFKKEKCIDYYKLEALKELLGE